MGWFDSSSKKEISDLKNKVSELSAKAHYSSYKPLFHVSFDGEKNLGELGALTKFHLDHDGLRHRSWEAYLSSEAAQTVIRKFTLWVIGSGLKLQSEPIDSVLKSSKINMNIPEFTDTVEGRFKLFTASKFSDFSRKDNIDRLARIAYTNAVIGGDVLVVLRVENGMLNIQLIDGAHVKTPMFSSHVTDAIARGNIIKNGVEQNGRGEHVAYYVTDDKGNVKIIQAKGESAGREMAFLVYGLDYRIDDNRGIPLLSSVLETIKKLERYKEAAVGSAEERQKIPYYIKHNDNSTGENPFTKALSKAKSIDGGQETPTDINGKELANTVAASTNKMVFNMPNGAELMALDAKNDLFFKEFYTVNIHSVCSTIGIPPEVALSKYDSNYSASRAALKDWEYTLNVERRNFKFQFYQRIYNFWLELEILQGRIQAPGYLTALYKKDEITLDAFRSCRFVGANVPHIDPLKEVQAERLKLGETGKHIPLTTVEAATESLNGGDSFSNIKQYGRELEEVKKQGIDPVLKVLPPTTNIKKKKEE